MQKTHGRSGTPVYQAWSEMKQRCFNPRSKDFACYGGRGIGVCRRWLSFDNFIADMGERPSPQHTIERRRRNGNYSKRNCYWATRVEQGRNTVRVQLSMEKARSIRTQYACGGVTYESLAEANCVSLTSIARVINHKTWREA